MSSLRARFSHLHQPATRPVADQEQKTDLFTTIRRKVVSLGLPLPSLNRPGTSTPSAPAQFKAPTTHELFARLGGRTLIVDADGSAHHERALRDTDMAMCGCPLAPVKVRKEVIKQACARPLNTQGQPPVVVDLATGKLAQTYFQVSALLELYPHVVLHIVDTANPGDLCGCYELSSKFSFRRHPKPVGERDGRSDLHAKAIWSFIQESHALAKARHAKIDLYVHQSLATIDAAKVHLVLAVDLDSELGETSWSDANTVVVSDEKAKVVVTARTQRGFTYFPEPGGDLLAKEIHDVLVHRASCGEELQALRRLQHLPTTRPELTVVPKACQHATLHEFMQRYPNAQGLRVRRAQISVLPDRRDAGLEQMLWEECIDALPDDADAIAWAIEVIDGIAYDHRRLVDQLEYEPRNMQPTEKMAVHALQLEINGEAHFNAVALAYAPQTTST